MTLSSRPVPTNRYNPCPVCENITGACRTLADETVFCHGFESARKKEKVNGYVCIKESNGHTATFRPDNSQEWTEERRREWENRKNERRQKAQEQAREREQRALPAQERHRLYSQILDQLSLDERTIADLQGRGFSQSEIEACGFKSIAKYQKLQTAVDSRLPGVAHDGQSLLVSEDGYACPLYDFNGQIVAIQLRLHHPTDNNRYRWLSSQAQTLAVYPEGENPLTVRLPQKLRHLQIGICEGTGAKPFLAAQRLGIPFIGASGGQHASSPKTLEKTIQQIAQALWEVRQEISRGSSSTTTEEEQHSFGNCSRWLKQNLLNCWQTEDCQDAELQSPNQVEIIITPDAGDVGKKDVIARWRKTANLIASLGWKVKFLWWGQVYKSFPDIDELELETYTTIRYLSIKEFEALCVKWGGLKPEKVISDPIPFNYQERVAQVQKKLHSLTYSADIICDSNQKYLPDLVGQIPTHGLVGIKSSKGSGKSYQIKKIKDHCCGYWEEKAIELHSETSTHEQLSLVDQHTTTQPEITSQSNCERIRHKGLGMNFLSINARIALGREQAVRWEFTWIEDADLEAQSEFEGTKLSSIAILENLNEIGLCWDSLSKVTSRDWSNTLVIIDELELGLNHVTTSSTCRERRSLILSTLELKLQECLNNGGLVVVADADLTDTSLDYLSAIAPGHIPFIVRHDFCSDPWDIHFFTGKRDLVLSKIEDWLFDPNCPPIALALDSQAEAEAISNHLLQTYPYLNKPVGGLIRIDSKVTQTEFGKNFVKRPNQAIQKLLPKILIYTPSLGVGCSIDIEYFAHVFGLFFGQLEPSQIRQALARVRASVPRTVWCKIKGNIDNEVTSFLPEAIKQNLFDYHNTSSQLTQLAINLAREKALSISNSHSDADILPHFIDILQQMMGPDGTWNNPHIDLYCHQIARRNYSLSQLAVQLRQELIEEGHNLYDFGSEDTTSCGDSVRAGKQELQLRDASLTALAPDISFEEAQNIKRKPDRSTDEIYAANKAFLKRELPGVELTPDFLYKAVYKDHRRWLNQVKLFWWCFHQDAVRHDDYKEWKAKLKQFSQGVPFLPDVRTYSPKVDAILKSGIFDWIDPDDLHTDYSQESPDAKQFVKTALKHKKSLLTALGVTVTRSSSPLSLANRILAKVGLALSFHRRTRDKGKRKGKQIRYYRLNEALATDNDRLSVLDALNYRWQNEIEQIAQHQSPQELDLCHNSDESLYNNSTSGTVVQPDELLSDAAIPASFIPTEQTPPIQSPQELDLCHNSDESSYNNPTSGTVVQPDQSLTDAWMQPSAISEVAYMLSVCEDSETLAELRRCDIPSWVFKAAASQLPASQREQIGKWVIEQNRMSA